MVNGAPPAEMSDESLVLYLSSRDPASEVLDFPLDREVENAATGDAFAGEGRKPIRQFRMMVLKAQRKIEAKEAAGKQIRDQFAATWKRQPTADDLASFDIQHQYDDYLACELLYRACRAVKRANPNSDGPAIYPAIFESARWMRDNLSSEEIGVLFRLYVQTSTTRSAIEQVLDDSPETLRLWVDRLKAGLWKLGPLARLASDDSAELCLSFAKLIARLESYGLPILDPQFLSSLATLASIQSMSTEERSSSGEPQESSSPTISPERALELAQQLRSDSE